MILKRYGTSYHSIEPNFDSKALNEVGFRRNREFSVPTDEFEASYQRLDTHELDAEAEGPVQDHTEQVLLNRLAAKLREVESGLSEGQVLVLDNADGIDYPKTRQNMRNAIVEGENKLYFNYTLAPALRMAVYQKSGA